MKLDEDGNPTIDMELVELNEITRASRCSKASWIGAVNLLEAAAADYQRRREVHCGVRSSLRWQRRGAWRKRIEVKFNGAQTTSRRRTDASKRMKG